jgi:general stress protein 26
MNRIEGMKEDLARAKVISLTTFDENGEARSRPMTNFNDDPYVKMWFPTFEYTRKVKDIRGNPKVLLNFPSSSEGEMYEIEGRAEFAPRNEVNERWEWWFLYWYPTRYDMAVLTDEPFIDRAIIYVHPEKARVKKHEK